MNRQRRLSAVLLSGIAVFFISQAYAQPGGGRAAPVVTAEVEQRQMAPTIWVPGTVVSQDDAEVAAEVAGRLTWVAEVGGRVARGAPVARLDDTLVKAEIAETEAQIRREEARLAFLEREAERFKALSDQRSVARSEFDRAKSEAQVAAAELAAARARLSAARERLARHVIRAPFSGVVTERLRRAGEWAAAGGAVARLADDLRLEIRGQIPGGSVPHLAANAQLAVARSAEHTQVPLKALVTVGDAKSHLYEIRLAVKGDGWRAGETVRIAVPSGASQQVLAVPRDALVLRRNGATVFRVNGDNVAERVEVTPGIGSGKLIQVSGPLQPGDRVVVRGGERLRPGQTVAPSEGGKRP